VTRTLSADDSAIRGGGVKTSDGELLRTLHDEHGGALWSYVVGLTNGDRAQAQDVVQETMLRAWRNPHVLEQASGSARGWLFTVAKRIVIDEWRTARSRRERVTEQLPEHPVADGVDRGRCRPNTGKSWWSATSGAHPSPRPRCPSGSRPGP
jgi:RNA polymerase sigma-70 factor (ECF subfamily)